MSRRLPPVALRSGKLKQAVAPAKPSPGTAWLAENALFQAVNATIWGSMLVGLVAIGSSLAAATTAALLLCLALPVIGWFIGLPFVLCFAALAAVFWWMALMTVLGAWACTTLTVAAVTFGRRMLDSRS